MEINEEEKDLVIDAVNAYWHKANALLKTNDLGDIERNNWENIKTRCTELMRRFGVL